MNLLVATNNLHKLKEFRAIIRHEHLIHSLDEVSIQSEPHESGEDFFDNAKIKLDAAKKEFENRAGKNWKHPQKNLNIDAILAEDSGFCVEALHGAPGVFSARFGNDQYKERQAHDKFQSLSQFQCSQILTRLKGVQNRNAFFASCIILLLRSGELIALQHHWHGSVVEDAPRGEGGFGYDPIFLVPEHSQTAAELSPQIKNDISHRALCVKRVFSML